MLRFDVDVDDDEKEESEDEYEENEDELGVPVVVFFFVVLLSLLLRLRFVVLLSPSSSSTRLYFSLPTLSTCSVSNDFPEPRDPIKERSYSPTPAMFAQAAPAARTAAVSDRPRC